jgi:RHS repeat-associated protein
MKISNYLILTTSPLPRTAKKLRVTASLTRRQRPLYGRKRHHPTGKERDEETGLYYYGARYLDPKTSRWLSGDPAIPEYIPSAPVSDEARERNGSLPGMGGVFNVVNLHVYHYAGNNPVKYVDPDGETIIVNNSNNWLIIRGEKEQIRAVRPGDTYDTEKQGRFKNIDGILMHDGSIFKINNGNRRTTLTVSQNNEGAYDVQLDAVGHKKNARGDYWKNKYNNSPFLKWLFGWLVGRGDKELSGMKMKDDAESEAVRTWWTSPMDEIGLTNEDIKNVESWNNKFDIKFREDLDD